MTDASGSGRGTPLAASLRRWSAATPNRRTRPHQPLDGRSAQPPRIAFRRRTPRLRPRCPASEPARVGSLRLLVPVLPKGSRGREGGRGGRRRGGGTLRLSGQLRRGRAPRCGQRLVGDGDGVGVGTGTGGLSGGRFSRGAGLDSASSSSRLISVGSAGAGSGSAATTGMVLLSRLGGGGGGGAGTWAFDPREGLGPEPSSPPYRAPGRGGGGGGGARRGRAVLSEPASAVEGA